MKRILIVACALLIFQNISQASDKELITVGMQKQLLVDDFAIEKKQNIVREPGKPVKIGVVMDPSLPTDFDPVKKIKDGLPQSAGAYEFGRRLSVIWNEKRQVFQMLYRASAENLTGCAESTDGIKWIKPIISDDGKSNLITYSGKNRGTFYEASFMIDPTVSRGHPEKYKAAYNPGDTQCAIAYSKDGIHWKGYHNGESVTGRAAAAVKTGGRCTAICCSASVCEQQRSASRDLQKEFSTWREQLEKERQRIYQENKSEGEFTFDGIMPAPDDPALWPSWRTWLDQWRKDQRKALNYDDNYYRAKEFDWIPSNLVSTKVMSWEMLFIDPETSEYTIDKFLDYGQTEYGGFDNVLLWQAYPRIGFDDRNQFDHYRDLPGGLDGLRQVVKTCHMRGVKVFICYNPWDTATRRESGPDEIFADEDAKDYGRLTDHDSKALNEIVKTINADGIYLDTWHGSKELRKELDKTGTGLAMQTELAVEMDDIATHHMSWGQAKPWKTWLFKDSYAPGVVRNKWFERRHVVYPTNRWISDRTGNLHTSWMNGTGTLVWENRFGCWDGWSLRDRSILRSMIPIQRRYINIFAGEGWTPLVERQDDDVFGSLWQDSDLRIWTLVNRAEKPYTGKLLTSSHEEGTIYFDLIRGTKAHLEIKDGIACINGSIDARGIGGIIAIPEKVITMDFAQFLQNQSEIFNRRNPDTEYPQGEGFVTALTRTAKYDRDSIPEGMAAIDAARVKLEVSLNNDGSPSGFYWKTPKERDVKLSAYAIDLTPVTNAQYAAFVKDSGYKPRHQKNFLKHWVNGKPPEGKEDHPVVYVDLEDARAYAKWAGKRLPTENEWQYAAQGPKGLKYPWGNKMKLSACNDGQTGGTTSVYKFPEGRSPFGCYDMSGNTWEWTESERSNEGRTRFCFVRGGSFYKIKGSHWYADGGALPCGATTKFLLVWPGLDRCSTIGFRCVADLADTE